MASLYRPTYTVPDPATGERVKRRSKVWWGAYKDAAGQLHRVSLETRDRSAAQLKLADLVRSAAAPPERRGIGEHICAWEQYLYDRGRRRHHVRMLLFRLRRVVVGCGWRTLGDMRPADADRFIATLRSDRKRGHSGRPLSAKTTNDYRETLRAFGRWLCSPAEKRLTSNPFTGWRNVTITTDRRHDRRPLMPEQLGRLLVAARTSPRVFRSLTGEDRYYLYLAATATGFRAGELASLTPESFALDALPPVVRIQAARTKNQKPVQQPLPADVVPLLRGYIASKPPGVVIWPGGWVIEGGEMIAADLADAGIPYVVDGPDGPLYADFHALRHTYIAMLDVPGMTIKKAMQLARHSDPRLTMRVYGKAQLADLSTAVTEALGINLVQATDAARRDLNGRDANTGSTEAKAAQGSPAVREGERVESDGPACEGMPTPWRRAFFVVHAEALCIFLALAMAAIDATGERRRAA